MTTNPHNPDGLTAEQVGQGWRLLSQQEVRNLPSDAEVWAFSGNMEGHWKPSMVRGCPGFAQMSYRTRIEQPTPALTMPTEAGQYRVSYTETGAGYRAEVRENGATLEASIPLIARGWVTVESLVKRGWDKWEKADQ